MTKASEQAHKQEFPYNFLTSITHGSLYMMYSFCTGALWPVLCHLYILMPNINKKPDIELSIKKVEDNNTKWWCW